MRTSKWSIAEARLWQKATAQGQLLLLRWTHETRQDTAVTPSSEIRSTGGVCPLQG
jgi:hypothetical protein